MDIEIELIILALVIIVIVIVSIVTKNAALLVTTALPFIGGCAFMNWQEKNRKKANEGTEGTEGTKVEKFEGAYASAMKPLTTDPELTPNDEGYVPTDTSDAVNYFNLAGASIYGETSPYGLSPTEAVRDLSLGPVFAKNDVNEGAVRLQRIIAEKDRRALDGQIATRSDHFKHLFATELRVNEDKRWWEGTSDEF